jgi:ABC-2 type transport system permease protein
MSDKREVRFWGAFLYMRQGLSIVKADARKLLHDPSELVTRTIQPVMWLLLFGQAMASITPLSPGRLPYLDYLAPGVLAQSILAIAIFYGVGLIWEKDTGILPKLLVTPVPRLVLVMGRAIAAGVRSLSQVVLIYLLSSCLGVRIQWNPLPLLGLLIMVMLGAAIFSTLSLIMASVLKKRERLMGLGQALTMPLFFASNALYPIEMMPDWIRVCSLLNPLTYQVDAFRSLMILGEVSHFGLLTDFGITFVLLAIVTGIATLLLPKILY